MLLTLILIWFLRLSWLIFYENELIENAGFHIVLNYPIVICSIEYKYLKTKKSAFDHMRTFFDADFLYYTATLIFLMDFDFSSLDF